MAARVRNPIVVLGEDGKPLAGASVQTNLRPSGTAASVFAAETGGTAGSNPATTDAHGRVTQWLARGAYSSVISATGLTTYSEAWDAVPGGDGAIDEDALEALVQAVIDKAPSYAKGTHAARPTPAAGTTFYEETDTGLLFLNTGSAWVFPGIPAGSITAAMLQAAIIGDTQIAANRQLLTTSNSYGARGPRVLGTEYEPSPSRFTYVVIDLALEPTPGFGKGAKVYVDGVLVAEVFEGGQATVESGVRKSVGFLVPPGHKWHVVDATGTGGVGGLFASYLTL